jgi:multimeric flavodoxin WrbA
MKVLALNSGPRATAESYTSLMLNHLVEGMKEEGADVEVIQLRTKKIRNCIGCFTCWTKTPGKCVHKDDMTNELFPKFLASDLVIYASPLYFHTVNAQMAAFMERTLPAALPFFEEDEDGVTYHPMRFKTPAGVILSVCGFPEHSEFDAMKDFFERTRDKNSQLVAVICRSAANLLSAPQVAAKAGDVLEATRQAGRELVRNMKIEPETMDRITRSLGNPRSFRKMGNVYWKTCIAEKVTPKEYERRKMVPRPQNLEDFMFIFPFGLNAKAAGDKKVLIQFNFTGKINESCIFKIEKGRVEAEPGTVPNPDITIDTDFDLWMDVITGKADGQKLFMEEKYKVRGDLGMMTKLFGGK